MLSSMIEKTREIIVIKQESKAHPVQQVQQVQQVRRSAGPAGPQGIQGIIGPNGTQGPIGPNGTQGPNQIVASSLYFEIGEGDSSAGGSALDVAECDLGDTAISGSYAVTNIIPGSTIADNPSLDFDSWEAQVSEDDLDEDSGILAFVICFDNPPTHIP